MVIPIEVRMSKTQVPTGAGSWSSGDWFSRDMATLSVNQMLSMGLKECFRLMVSKGAFSGRLPPRPETVGSNDCKFNPM